MQLFIYMELQNKWDTVSFHLAKSHLFIIYIFICLFFLVSYMLVKFMYAINLSLQTHCSGDYYNCYLYFHTA